MRDERYRRRDDYQNCWYKDMCDTYQCDGCHRACGKFTQTDYMFQMSDLPKSMWRSIAIDDSELSDRSAEVLNTIVSDTEYFVRNGFNLYLYGDPGTGKTSWAVKILNNYFASVADRSAFTTRGLFVNVPSFMVDAKFKLTYKSQDYIEYLEEIKNCDVVVWDDVYTSSNETHYESQMLYSLINSRIFAKKCNIFTSNMSPDKLESVSERMASRICNNSDCIEITGTDKRGQMLYTNFMNEWKEADSVEVDNDGTDTSSE